MEQVTGDSGAGARLGSFESSAWAIGPAAQYGFVVGKTPLAVLLKWMHEVSTTDTFHGNTVTIVISFKI